MFKKGDVNTNTYFVIIDLILITLLFYTYFNYISEASSTLEFNKNFLARDLSLMIDTLYLAPGEVSGTIPLSEKFYIVAVGKTKEGFIVNVNDLYKVTAVFYPYTEDTLSNPLNVILGEPLGVEIIEFFKDRSGIVLSELYPGYEKSVIRKTKTRKVLESIPVIKDLLPKEKEEKKPTDFQIQVSKQTNFIWPASEKIITSCYGKRTINPGDEGSTYHLGVDVRSNFNSEVKAAADGVVKEIGPSYGRVTLLHRNNVETAYIHLNSVSIKEKQNIKKGEVIGFSGGRGPRGPKQYNPHLHFEVHVEGKAVDPLLPELKIFDAAKLNFASDSNCNYNSQNYAYKSLIRSNIV